MPKLKGAGAVVTLAWLVATTAVGRTQTVPTEPAASLPYSPSLDLDSMDRSVNPCDDLYTYACGGWKKRNPIPADQTSWSVYSKLTRDNQRYLWGILLDAATPDESRTPSQQRIGDYFAACMDTDAIERAGLTPLEEPLARIGAVDDARALSQLLGSLHRWVPDSRLLFGTSVQQDAADANRVIASIDAGGLGLPDRDYYLNEDDRSVEIRKRYVEHITKMLTLLGDSPDSAEANAAAVMLIETALARASLTKVDRRDPYEVHHSETLASLAKLAPAVDWPAYFDAVGVTPEPRLNLEEPAFLKAVNDQLAQQDLTGLKAYLRWSLVDSQAALLSSAFVQEDFAFKLQYLRGVDADRARWRKCVAWVDDDLGEALGVEFVSRTFPPATKEKTVTMTRQIEDAMRRRIERLDWMSPQTKAQALAKLAKVHNKVGFPKVWRNYDGLVIQPGEFFANARRSAEFEMRRQAAKIGRPVDRDEWQTSAPTVNAFYDPAMNDITFPAGVLSPPLFDAKMDDAPNYGDTGGTIGHELTHGFDDEGRQFDGDGNLRDWWTKEDARRFAQRAKCIRDQYSQYTIVDDIKIDGALTLGEDTADLGGELLAWMAWQEQSQGQPLVERDGLTPAQRFFVGFAQWACANDRPEELRVEAKVETHSPPRERINGVVANMPDFAASFHCKAGRKLVKRPQDLCRIW